MNMIYKFPSHFLYYSFGQFVCILISSLSVFLLSPCYFISSPYLLPLLSYPNSAISSKKISNFAVTPLYSNYFHSDNLKWLSDTNKVFGSFCPNQVSHARHFFFELWRSSLSLDIVNHVSLRCHVHLSSISKSVSHFSSN